ncbi:pyruvate dehydrogenase E2 component (dihydrolipoamide acetyltransferase) [Agromyces hippuratus]|uniref:Dihydrolipoamide acetyltransferase component of pyruvate dehydrogenase complex n=1 Tax=Agromyces hippuratus TaxID=286438 RepID=A0A852WPT4_9MICO|nr:dihydrolipoamide acetyltransferase family protein [Agromyces hippuratus]NYG19979.1 pyruvate dehydrogenase E2 component (dihydrolipoamide acetyltransferase) [Agromyces hippuratus]
MSREFILPDLGEGLTEAEIVAWLVAPGDQVAIDQVVVELESAKSVVQLPTPFAGVVESLGGEVGQVLHAGTVLLTLRSDAEVPDVAEPAEPGIVTSETALAEESGAVLIGYGTRQSTVTKRAASAPARFGRRGGAGVGTGSGGVGGGASTGPRSNGAARLDAARRSPVVSPIVRRLAREHGFDASQLLGSGHDHLVMRRDVESFIAEQEAPTTAPTAAASAAPSTPAVPATAPIADREGDRRVPLDRMARAAAAHFSRSRREIPEATVWMDVDATGLLAARRQLQEATGERFGITALIARFVIAGLAKHPALNASFDAERDELVLHSAVNLGLAAQTPRGLLVPVVHGAERMPLRTLRDAITARTEEAATGVFPPSALTGGTFTLNNYGTLGVDGSAAIINHPEAAMLGVGRFIERPWVVDGALAVRTVTELTISFDHRVCDGAEAAAFLTFVARCIERPVSVLAEL